MSKINLDALPSVESLQRAAARVNKHYTCLSGIPEELTMCNALAVSKLFDTDYYMSEYPDIADTDIDPILHYVRYGAHEGRNPAPWFNTKEYIADHIDAIPADMNPFLHCLRSGKFEKKVEAKTDTTKKLIISLTSFPKRIDIAHLAIETLLNQSMKADSVILWLAEEDFSRKEAELPDSLLALCARGLRIQWCKNIYSYKKLIPTLQEYPESTIVTADDDVLYDNNWLKLLYLSYKKQPQNIHCHRAHRISISKQNTIKKYMEWKFCIEPKGASFLNFFTGAGGVLYPPHCFHKDVLDETLFMQIAPHGDDIWFWAMAVLNGTKIVVVKDCINNITPIQIDNDQTLWESNSQGGNDKQLEACCKHYPQIMDTLLHEIESYKKQHAGHKASA